MFSESGNEGSSDRFLTTYRRVIALRKFKIETSSVLLALGIVTYGAIYGSPHQDPKFKISHRCEDNKHQNNKQARKHIEITVQSEFKHETGTLAIYWTPQRIKRYNPEDPFPGSVTESLETPNGFSYPPGETSLVRILSSPNSDINQAINGRIIATALVPLTCK